jgi:amidohydrolase
MDCLPVEEENDVPYRSQNPGFMHACGHDAHTSILLAVARLLAARRLEIPGTIKFAFQPAEESHGGGRHMVEEGVLENPHVDACFALHVWNTIPVGRIGIVEGPAMAGTGLFDVRMIGKGGHGAAPHLTVDPIVAASQAVLGVQTIISRNRDPLTPAVITIGRFHGGTAPNVIPDEVELCGTIRSFDDAVHEFLAERVRQVFEGAAAGAGCTVAWDYHRGYPVVINDPVMCGLVRDAAADVVGAVNVVTEKPSLGGEDFAYYARERPSCIFFVGSANAERGLSHPHHNPKFDIDEDAMRIGALAMVRVVEKYLSMG